MSNNLTTPSASPHNFTNRIVNIFLHSNLSIILILLAAVLGLTALGLTPREEDPQIVVPLADVYVSFPDHSAAEVEQQVTTPLEKILYQIDGVEYVYSMSRENQAIITVRFYVGEDRERSLVKLHKKIDEHLDIVPPGTINWVVKPVEIDDVPVATMTLASHTADNMTLRRVAEELTERLAAVQDVSRAYIVGGTPRVIQVLMDPDLMAAHHVSPLELQRAIQAANVRRTAGDFRAGDRLIRVEAGEPFTNARQLGELVVGVFDGQPVFLNSVAKLKDEAEEISNYVRHGWGPARDFTEHQFFPGTLLGAAESESGANADAGSRGATGNSSAREDKAKTRQDGTDGSSACEENVQGAAGSSSASEKNLRVGDPSGATTSVSAVTIAIAKKKGSNAVRVADAVLRQAEQLRDQIVPSNMDLVVTRNYGLTANEKVNELVEALAVAIVVVVALLTLGLGWREALIVAVAVPVVFGLTLAVNLMLGFTINRVTLFALILSLGLLVDDPIVDVENIARHFALRKKATRGIVLEAVSEIRPPLITATLAVIVSFLPMFFITGMMGPYMRPMALNVPVTMFMSMLVAFTITPWMAFHVLKRKYTVAGGNAAQSALPDKPAVAPDHVLPDKPAAVPESSPAAHAEHGPHDLDAVKQSRLYKIFYPLMAPLLHSKLVAWAFLLGMVLLTFAAMGLGAMRAVPLKMLPFDNKNELLLVLDLDEGTTLERTDAAVRDFESYLAGVPEVVDYTSYVGLNSPMDFNGLVRHYYLRRGDNVAEVRIDLVGKKNRRLQSHAIGLRMRDDLQAIADRHNARMKLVETPPGPPVIASVVAEVYGQPDNSYQDILLAADTVRARLAKEPGVVDIDDSREAPQRKMVFVTDKEKAAIAGITVQQIAETLKLLLAAEAVSVMHNDTERNPLRIELLLPIDRRSNAADLSKIQVKGGAGQLVSLDELGKWQTTKVDQMIYHKNLHRVAYVFAETAGRPPADVVVDVMADRSDFDAAPKSAAKIGAGWLAQNASRSVAARTFLSNGGGVNWSVPSGFTVDFAGEGEWKITLDVFRDLGLAFGAAMIGIYILLVAQTGSFAIPLVVMLAIPLTILGVMPGFWLLNALNAQSVGGYLDPVYFTATGMIGMIALAGIVTRDSIILVDFIHLSLRRGRSLFDAIMESRVVRLRPILLTAAAAMLGAVPIIIDPIFSGLAWSLIFGLLASTLFTLFVIPISYWLLYANKPGHGLPMEEAESADNLGTGCAK
jgi:multidrug efflux pump subunit AcrB